MLLCRAEAYIQIIDDITYRLLGPNFDSNIASACEFIKCAGFFIFRPYSHREWLRFVNINFDTSMQPKKIHMRHSTDGATH